MQEVVNDGAFLAQREIENYLVGEVRIECRFGFVVGEELPGRLLPDGLGPLPPLSERGKAGDGVVGLGPEKDERPGAGSRDTANVDVNDTFASGRCWAASPPAVQLFCRSAMETGRFPTAEHPSSLTIFPRSGDVERRQFR